MIADTIELSERYDMLGARFAAAFAFLRSGESADLPVGRHDVMGDEVFALVQEYQTAPAAEKRWEAHRKYADIQYIVSGEEAIGWALTESLDLREDLFEDKDIAFYAEAADHAGVRLEAGMFTVFFPSDAHKPGCSIGLPSRVRKIVMKVALF